MFRGIVAVKIGDTDFGSFLIFKNGILFKDREIQTELLVGWTYVAPLRRKGK